jgi:hypothetical protein
MHLWVLGSSHLAVMQSGTVKHVTLLISTIAMLTTCGMLLAMQTHIPKHYQLITVPTRMCNDVDMELIGLSYNAE